MTAPVIPNTPGARAARRLPKKAQNRFWRIVNMWCDNTWEQIFRGASTKGSHEILRRVETQVICLRLHGGWFQIYDSADDRVLHSWRAR